MATIRLVSGRRRHSVRPNNFRLAQGHPLSQGLVFAGLGQLPGSKFMNDSSLWRNTGTLTNMDPPSDWVWVPELGRYACDLDGTNDWITCGNTASTDITGPVTVSGWAWIRTLPGVGKHPCIVSRLQDYKGYSINFNGPSIEGLFGFGGVLWKHTPVHAPSLFTWYHYVAQFDGAYLRLFANGIEITPATANTAPLVSAAASLLIGPHYSNPATYGYLNGRVADVSVWNRALSRPEIAMLANRSDPMLGGLIKPINKYWFGIGPGVSFVPRRAARQRAYGPSVVRS